MKALIDTTSLSDEQCSAIFTIFEVRKTYLVVRDGEQEEVDLIGLPKQELEAIRQRVSYEAMKEKRHADALELYCLAKFGYRQ